MAKKNTTKDEKILTLDELNELGKLDQTEVNAEFAEVFSAEEEVATPESEPVEETVNEPEGEAGPGEPEFVKVKAHQNFRDGAFKKDFEDLGYTKSQWNEGEVRLLPPRLYFKLQQRSGNQFSLVGGQDG